MQIRSCRLDNRRTFDNFGFVHPWKVACFLAVSQQSLTGHVTHPQATVRLPRFHIFTCFQIAPGPGQKFTINHQKLLIFGTTQKPLSAIRVEFKKTFKCSRFPRRGKISKGAAACKGQRAKCTFYFFPLVEMRTDLVCRVSHPRNNFEKYVTKKLRFIKMCLLMSQIIRFYHR
jgi:hypothetical protein